MDTLARITLAALQIGDSDESSPRGITDVTPFDVGAALTQLHLFAVGAVFTSVLLDEGDECVVRNPYSLKRRTSTGNDPDELKSCLQGTFQFVCVQLSH